MYRNLQRGFTGGNEFFTEPSTPPKNSRSSNQRKDGDESSSEYSPGLLDLHSFDTELLPEVGCLHTIDFSYVCYIGIISRGMFARVCIAKFLFSWQYVMNIVS